jgi:HEPN domain-containing protein
MSLSADLYMAQRWLQTAEDDLKAAGALLQAGLSAHACFAAQQCGEKAVKALWYLAGEDPWGNSIMKLVAGLPQREGITDIASWMEKAAGLDKFYIPTRYPNGLPDLTPGQVYLRSDAEAGIAMASFLLDAARGMLAAEHKTPGHGNDTDEAEANQGT